MVALDAEGRRKRAQAASRKWHYPDQPELWADDLRDLRVDAAEEHIRELLSRFPAPTAEQRARLAELLAPAEDAARGSDAA